MTLAVLQGGCSQGGRAPGRGGIPILSQIVAEPVLTEEAVDRLKAIAEAPSSHLPHHLAVGPDSSDASSPDSPPSGGPASPSDSGAATEVPTAPELAWRRDGFEPRAVSIGDVFSQHAGPILNKTFSFADLLPADQWTALAADLGRPRTERVPLTMTARDVAAMREQLGDSEIPFPTRSVALDLRTETIAADTERLRDLYRRVDEEDASFPEPLRRSLRQTRERLERGETLFIVVAVTRSLSTRANYPGAPIGQRDVEAIRNAVRLAYPHLDGLLAERDGNAVRIRREPDLYWEFDTREIALGPAGIEIRPLAGD